MKLRNPLLMITIALALVGVVSASKNATAKGPHASKKNRVISSFEGKISGLSNGRDKKKKHYWEYKLHTPSGETIIVHDYQYGRYRQPATMGLQEGAKRKVRGFFVHIPTKHAPDRKESVLIVSPAN